jgi:ubiquitin carboxyl-terminal hydrolase 8
MPGVAVLPPSSPRLAGFGPDTRSGTYLPRQSSNPSVDSPTMQNGSLSLGTVSDIKSHAKSFAEQTSKGYGAKTLIGSARSQIQQGQSADAAGHPKEALRAFYIAVTLASKCMDSKGSASNGGSRSNHEFLQFYQVSIIHPVHHSNSMISSTGDYDFYSRPHQDP